MTTQGGVFGEITTPQVTTGNPATCADATAKMPIGAKFRYNGAIYRYVKHNTGTGAVASAVGAPAWAKTLTPAATATAQPVCTVTPDQTDSIFGKRAIGVYLAASITNNYFCCIQIGGLAQVKVIGAVAGDQLIGGTTDGQFERIASGSALTEILMGNVSNAASASSISTALLSNMDW